jgi:cytochrome P450
VQEIPSLSASRRHDRPRPPAPEPLEKPPGPFKTLRILRANPIASLTRAHFEQPIVITKSVLGNVAYVSDPTAIRYVLIERSENYRKGRQHQRIMTPALGNGLATAEGDRWRTQRRLVGRLFTPRSVAGFAPAMAASASALVERWKKLQVRSRLDVAAEMARTAIDVLERTIFVDGIKGDPNEVAQALTHYFNTVGRLTLLNILNAPDWVPRLGRWRARRSLALSSRTADMIIEACRKRLLADPLSAPADLVSILLMAGDAKTGRELSDAEIRSNIATFIATGYETSAVVLTWALYLLSLDPEWRERVETEVDRELPASGYVDDSLERLVATRAVIEETMRLYPSVPAIHREAISADQLATEAIDPGTIVVIYPWVVHRHRLLWEAPDLFDPSRFLPGSREAIDRFAYLPFGAGPRGCIGASFALQEAIIVLATIVRTFRLELAPDHKVWPVHRITLRPQGGLPMVLHRRQHSAPG